VENSHDYGSYEKSLTNILDQIQKEFWAIAVDWNRHQVIVGKNNLWVAAALIGAYATLYNKFHDTIDLTSCVGLLFCMSFTMAVTAFGLCLYGMPSRKGYMLPCWSKLTYDAYERLENKTDNSYVAYMTEMIKQTDELNKTNRSTNSKRSKIFRATSWLLIGSFFLCLLFGVLYLFDISRNQECQSLSINTKKYVRCIMNNEKSASNSQPEQTTKPNVPEPQKPTETSARQMHLDSADIVIKSRNEVIKEAQKKDK
jgi:hypothetical protein